MTLIAMSGCPVPCRIDISSAVAGGLHRAEIATLHMHGEWFDMRDCKQLLAVQPNRAVGCSFTPGYPYGDGIQRHHECIGTVDRPSRGVALARGINWAHRDGR